MKKYSFIGVHYFSIISEDFRYRVILKNHFKEFNDISIKNNFKISYLFKANKLESIIKKECENGFLHFYGLSFFLTHEIFARHLNG